MLSKASLEFISSAVVRSPLQRWKAVYLSCGSINALEATKPRDVSRRCWKPLDNQRFNVSALWIPHRARKETAPELGDLFVHSTSDFRFGLFLSALPLSIPGTAPPIFTRPKPSTPFFAYFDKYARDSPISWKSCNRNFFNHFI